MTAALALLSLVALAQAQATPPCAIAGRVTDEAGQPIPHLRVFAARAQFIGGQQRVLSGGTRTLDGAATDVHGAYRLPNLPPNEYFVNVLSASSGGGSPVRPRLGFAPTFYPAARDVSDAVPIDLRTDCNAEGIDIVVRPVPLAAIGGIVRGVDGSVLTMGGVTAVPDSGAARLRSVPVRPDGTFVFEDMAPGKYLLRGTPLGALGSLPAVPTAEVTVDGIDVTGVVLAPERLVTVRGRLSSGEGRRLPLPSNRLRVVANSMDQVIVPGVARVSSLVEDDFSFTLEVPRGQLVLSVASTSGALPPGWALEAVRIDGIDVSDVLEARGDLSGVEIVLTSVTQELFGSVHDSTGAAAGDYVVLVFAQDPSRWSIPLSRYVVRVLPKARGPFSAASLPPGDYYAVALPRTHADRWQDPRFLERIAPLATPVSLDTGKRIELNLTLACERVTVC